MKTRVLTLLMLLSFVGPTNAQGSKACFYGSFGGGVGLATTALYDIGVNFKLENFASSATMLVTKKNADNVPYNYQPGLHFFERATPQQYLSGLSFEAGPVFYLPAIKSRILLKAGVFIGFYDHPENFTPSSGFLSANYTYERIEDEAFGLVLHPVLELPVNKWFGFSVGARGIFSDASSMAAIDINLMVGKVKNSRH